MLSLTAMSLALVKLYSTSFCLVDTAYAAPLPFVMNTHVCYFMLFWTANEPYMCHLTELVLSSSRISRRCLVACRYFIIRWSLYQLWLVSCCNLVHRNNTAVCISDCNRLERYSDFATRW